MVNEVIIKSPAKLNLHLKVFPKRNDGYHDIESLFQAISLFDDVIVTKSDNNKRCMVNVTSVELPLENTLTVAYKEFCSYTGITNGVDVRLNKQIFSGAGLGGGSSNGAAMITALDSLFDTNLSRDEKVAIALKVGSDVPFFMYGGAAIVTGRGEFVRSIKMRDDLFFVVIMPDLHSSTKEAFCLFDEYNDSATQYLNLHEVEQNYLVPIGEWTFSNSFTNPLVKKFPAIGSALHDLTVNGSDFSQMSGSGAAVFGVFKSEGLAKKAYTQLYKKWTCRLVCSYSV